MSGSIPNEFIDHLLQRIDIYDIVSPRVSLKKSGKDYSGLCPFHTENTPSFTVSQVKQFYHCFGCGKSGSAISFLMEYEGLDFIDAVTELAQKAGMEVPAKHIHANKSQANLYEIIEKANRIYQHNLKKNLQVIDYLKQRGISGTTAKRFQLGYAEDKWNQILQNFSAEDQPNLKAVGLTTTSDNNHTYDKFRNRLMFPIQDKRGRVIAFGGRVLDPAHKPKYLNSPETPLFHKNQELYGYHLARKHSQENSVFVVEGYMDVIMLHEHEIFNAVATLGTAVSADHIKLLNRIWDETIFCFDGDQAGRNAAEKAMFICLNTHRDDKSMRFLFLADGEDPDSYVRANGKGDFLKAAESAMTLSDFILQVARTGINLETIDGRARFHEKCIPIINQLPNGNFKLLLQEKVTEITHIGFNKSTQPQLKNISFDLTPVGKLIGILLENPSTVKYLPEDIKWGELSEKGVKILLKIIEICRNNPHITTASALENFRNTRFFEQLGSMTQQLNQLNKEQKILELQDIVAYFAKKIRQYRINMLRNQQLGQGLSPEQKTELLQLLSQQNND